MYGKAIVSRSLGYLFVRERNPLNNIAFSLFCHVVSCYSLSETICMPNKAITACNYTPGIRSI